MMLNNPLKTLMTGVATATLLATGAVAQTAQIDTPEGRTVIVPEAALETAPSEGFVVESDYPMLDSVENNQVIAETLIAQGYSDVVISREGPMLTVTAQRAGVPIELVYSTANGRLVSVDGVETRADADPSSANDDMMEPGLTEGTPDDESADDAMTDGATGDSMTDGADATPDMGDMGDTTEGTDATDGGDAGDTGSDTGSQDGSDAGAGGDTGGDSGSDAGGESDDGSDSGSDGGSDGSSDGGDSNS